MGAVVYSKMATLSSRRILLLRKIQKTAFANVAKRSMGDVKPWNYLWKPGPYPETEEERIAAAKKYGLIPEDYKPYPRDGTWNKHIGPQGLGDYPMLEPSSGDSRSGHVNWDDPDLKRNFGEPLHYNFYKQQETRYDDTTKHRYSEWQSFGMFLLAIAMFGGPYLILKDYPLHKPCTIDQLPYRGKTY